MKKLLAVFSAMLSILAFQSVHAQEDCNQNGCCPPDQACGDCYCKYVRYVPRYYNTQRCVEEQVPCTKRCCRYVPQYYQVQRCRYVPEYYQVQRCRYVPEYYNETRCRQVPEYYNETKCRQVPEYYDVQEYKTCTKKICEPQVECVPQYYWKRECQQSCDPQNF